MSASLPIVAALPLILRKLFLQFVDDDTVKQVGIGGQKIVKYNVCVLDKEIEIFLPGHVSQIHHLNSP
jgi:hypothetical protein